MWIQPVNGNTPITSSHMAKFLGVKISGKVGRKIGQETLWVQSEGPVFLRTTVLLLDFINKLKIGSAFYFSANYFSGVTVPDLVPLSSRKGATGSPTHFFMILTSCGNPTFSPVDCVGPLRARSFILPHRSNHTESCAVSDTTADTPHTGKHVHASHYFKTFFFSPSDWARPDVGGGLAAAPCGASARYWAADWTELLPRQAIGGRDARAQDFYTQSTTTAAVNEARCPDEAILILSIRSPSTETRSE